MSSPSPLETRRVRAAEYRLVGDLTLAAYEPFLLGPDDFYRERLTAVEQRDREAEVWVAAEDGVVLGNLTICPPHSPWTEIAQDGEGEFRMLAVAPGAQGRGVGRALVSLAVDRFRRDGARGVALSSLDQMSTAHHLYGHLGFVRAPERDWTPAPDVRLLALTLTF